MYEDFIAEEANVLKNLVPHSHEIAKKAAAMCERILDIAAFPVDVDRFARLCASYMFWSAYVYSVTGKSQKPFWVDPRSLKNRLLNKITVIGLGGGGGNAINNMVMSKLSGVRFVAANTDAQDLRKSLAEYRIQLGERISRGLGAGADPSRGRDAALESVNEIHNALRGSDMVFITAGMGGGTGTGSAPVVAQIAKEVGALTVAVVTTPFYFEGKRRMEQARRGISDLQRHADALVVLHNDRLLQMATKKSGFGAMLKMADEVLYYGVKCISELITCRGLINLDFADVKAVLSNSGRSLMGTGGASGNNRAEVATRLAMQCPLLEDVGISDARRVLYNITANDLSLDEVNIVSGIVTENANPDANIIFGVVYDDNIDDELRVSIIASHNDALKPEVQMQKYTSIRVRYDSGNIVAQCVDDNNDTEVLTYGHDVLLAGATPMLDDEMCVPDYILRQLKR